MSNLKSTVKGKNILDLFVDAKERNRYAKRMNNRSKGLGKFWHFTEYIFLTSADCYHVDSFNLLPVDGDDVTFGAKNKYHPVDSFASPVLDLFHVRRSSYRTVLVVCVDGSVTSYEPTGVWWLQHGGKTVTKLVSQLDSKLVSVALHPGHSALYWCETKAESSDQWSFGIFKKNIYDVGGNAGSGQGIAFGEMLCLVRNCPPANFVQLKDHVLLWFSARCGQHCPPGLYLMVAEDGSVTTRVFGHVAVTGFELGTSTTDDFMQRCVHSMNIWSSESISHLKVVHVEPTSNSRLVTVVENERKALITKQNGEVVTSYDLPVSEGFDSKYFVLDDILCVITDSGLASACLKGPELSWNFVNFSTFSLLTNGNCRNTATAYVLLENDIYRWTAKDFSSGAEKQKPILSKLNDAYRERRCPLDSFEWSSSNSQPPVICSDSLKLTLIERCLERNASPLISKEIGEHLNNIPKLKSDTDLNKTIEPLVNTFLRLQEEIDSN